MVARRVLLGVIAVVTVGCAAAVPTQAPPPAPPSAPPSAPFALRPEVLAEIPHDTTAFTQGLELADGVLYEGTGLAGKSQLRALDPATGELRRAAPLPGELFGEGITVVGDRIWQLTWRDGVALEWDRATFELLRRVPMDGEGWGLCLLDDVLVRSDGTATLRFHDPATFADLGAVEVVLDGTPQDALNELECVDGQVWANVWRTDRIVRVDPADGRVTAVVDAAGLLDDSERAGTDVLNGIAAAGDGEFLVTGKLWPTVFRVRFVPVG